MTQPLQPQSHTWRRPLITIFILLHLYVMAFWGLPPSRFRSYMVAPIARYVLHSGLWHSWDMFSPDPQSMNFNLYAEVYFQDGSVKLWEFPRMEKLGYWERYQKERFRKWRDRVRQDIYSSVWNDTARYIARLHNTGPNKPVRVVMVRQWEPVPPPDADESYQPIPLTFHELSNSFRFSSYNVAPGDL